MNDYDYLAEKILTLTEEQLRLFRQLVEEELRRE